MVVAQVALLYHLSLEGEVLMEYDVLHVAAAALEVREVAEELNMFWASGRWSRYCDWERRHRR